MIENQNAEQTPEAAEEQLEIQVTDDPVEPRGQASGDDELETYTKSVSKRINKLNAKARRLSSEPSSLSRLLCRRKPSSSSIVNIHSSSRIRFC